VVHPQPFEGQALPDGGREHRGPHRGMCGPLCC
jgi:hypothetical protein